MPVSSLFLILLLIHKQVISSIPSFEAALAACTVSTSYNATCVPYPSTGVCAPYFPNGQAIYLPTGLQVSDIDQIVVSQAISAEQNAAVFTTQCYQDTMAFTCSARFLRCDESSSPSEPLPILPCADFCTAYWSTCNSTFKLFWQQVIQSNYNSSTIPNCVGGGTFQASWGATPQPPDTWGGRSIPDSLPVIHGLIGEYLYPISTYTYTYMNGSQDIASCYEPNTSVPISEIHIPPPICLSPLEISANQESCVIPCPFPLFNDDQENGIQWAFAGPAILGLFLCVFVCLDSSWVIYDSAGGRMGRILRNMLSFSSAGNASSSHKDSTAGSPLSSGGGKESRGRQRQIRSSTLYTLLGSLLGIVYFVVCFFVATGVIMTNAIMKIGPLGTLINGSNISCSESSMSLSDITGGTLPAEPTSCVAQRAAPFVLQAIFTLILYAMVRVFFAIDERVKRWDDRKKQAADILLVVFCVGMPITTLIIAFCLDNLSEDLLIAAAQLARQSTNCQVRVSQLAEWLLIFAPFIVTGVFVTGLSLVIFMRLRAARRNLGTVGIKNRTASDVALQLLIARLALLGTFSFATLIVVIGSTSAYVTQTNLYGPPSVSYMSCLIQHASCVDCSVWGNLTEERVPDPAALGVQLAAESFISVLFGIFFAAQSVSRLWKEYQDGTLQAKIRFLFRRSPGSSAIIRSHNSKSGHDGTAIMSSFNEDQFVETNSNLRDKQIAPAAYMDSQ